MIGLSAIPVCLFLFYFLISKLSDIPVVGVAIEKISEAAFEAGIRGLRYTLCYKTLVNQLNSEIEKVKIQEGEVSRKISAAKNNGKIIKKHVEEWQRKVQSIKTVTDELSGQTTSCTCFKVFPFPDLVSRFRLGRKAAHHSRDVVELTVSGRELVANEVGFLPGMENVPTSNSTYQIFFSRKESYGKLWEALVDKKGDPIIAIYGMPGVGKTRMMEQACKDAFDKNVFDKFARVNLSGEKFNVINLQEKLSASLDCHLDSKDNENQRASQLKTSLMNGGNTLVILDDVWDVIPLSNVGIPFGDGSFHGCKILLTSRKQDVCFRSECKDPIEIKTLTDGEAWAMFRNTVGSTKLETLKDASLAKKVCKKCAALPLLIDAVGNALKFVTENLWVDALYQLESHKFEEIEGISRQVYARLQLSFEKLNEAARTCLLLCSLFPEDHDIKIKMLFDLATGSQLLDRERNIDAVIDILKSSSLLLHDEDHDNVKLHNIIRDVARSIAARDPKFAFFSIRCSSWLLDNVDYSTPCRLLQLDLEEDNIRFPDDLVCPRLHALWLRGNHKSQQFSSGFFERFMNLKFLLLQGIRFPNGQQVCVHRLEKLRVLILNYCNIQQMLTSSISENLETLCLWRCHLPRLLELPQLKTLRKLELLHNSYIYIGGNVISSLSSLEELKILGGFTIRDDAKSIFAQLSQLIRFRNLMIDLDISQSYPDQDIVNKLVEFNIYVGSRGYYYPRNLRDSSDKSITFEGIDHIENGWMALVERAKKVEIVNVKGLANGFSNTKEAFSDLRELKIESCRVMKHLANWDGRHQPLTSSFSNLTSVNISHCIKLKYLFSSSVAKCFQQMQQLMVYDCPAIEEIIRVKEGISDQGKIIKFPKLKELNLLYLPKLTSFYTYKVTFPNMEKMTILCGGNTCFLPEEIELGRDDSPPKLSTLDLRFDDQEVEIPPQWLLHLKNIQVLKLTGCWWTGDSVFNGTPTFFRRLKELEIVKCGITSLFTCSSLKFFQQLEKLTVSNCPLLDEIVWGDKSNDKTTSLPQLYSIVLTNLPKLRNCGIFAYNMPALEEVSVSKCGLSTLFTSSAFAYLQKLGSLAVSECPLLENIVEDEIHDETPQKTISLLCLTNIRLTRLSSLRSFSQSSLYAFNMPALEGVTLYECPDMYIFTLLKVNVNDGNSDHTDISDLNRFVFEKVFGRSD